MNWYGILGIAVDITLGIILCVMITHFMRKDNWKDDNDEK